MSAASVHESPNRTLIDELLRRALGGERDARRLIITAAAKLQAPKEKKSAR